jgi:hypothetical protein
MNLSLLYDIACRATVVGEKVNGVCNLAWYRCRDTVGNRDGTVVYPLQKVGTVTIFCKFMSMKRLVGRFVRLHDLIVDASFRLAWDRSQN